MIKIKKWEDFCCKSFEKSPGRIVLGEHEVTFWESPMHVQLHHEKAKYNEKTRIMTCVISVTYRRYQ
jgi:hypothetical protein